MKAVNIALPKGRLGEKVYEMLRNAGFKNFEVEKQVKMKKGFLDKEGNIVSITINGQSNFNKDEWFDENAVIRIVYLAFM